MNNLETATETVKNGWCRDAFRVDLPEGTTFCATGALFAAMMGTADIVGEDGDIKEDLLDKWKDLQHSDEVRALDEIIKEQYPDINWDTTDTGAARTSNVIHFNDMTAKHSDEVVAVFEKATARMAEKS